MYRKKKGVNMGRTELPFPKAMSKAFPTSGGMSPTATMNRMGTPMSMYKEGKERKKGVMKQLYMAGM